MPSNVVRFHYTLRDTRGQFIDSSQGGEPVTYLEGSGQIIEGLESQMKSLTAGTKAQLNVPAAQAYGVRDDRMIQKVARAVLPLDEFQIGDQFQTGPDRHDPVVTIVAIEGDQVTLDANHPLAGVDLVFDVEVLDIRPATADETSHGHAHGPGGVHH